jgi:uncharacterized protein YfaS (alpha-2-macroglobulin family)
MKRVARVVLAGLLCLITISALLFYALTHDLPSPDALLTHASSGTTKILDRNGQLLYEIFDPRSGSLTPRLSLADPKLDPAVRWLMMQRQDGHWQTTQETSMSLVALTEYLSTTFERDGDYTYTVRVNGKEIATVKVTPQTLGKHGKWIIPLDDLGEGDPVVEITRNAGPGAPVRASISLRHYRASGIPTIDDKGVHVSRSYAIEKGKTLNDLAVGDIVTVTLSVRFDQHTNYVIVEDPLPAGLEPIDTSLATTAQNLGPKSNDWHDWHDWMWSHVELRDDRVALFATWMYYDNVLTYTYQARATTAGTFNVLPMQSYAMYKPDVIGRAAGMVVTVKNK